MRLSVKRFAAATDKVAAPMVSGAAVLGVGHGLGDATPALGSLVAQIGETLLAIGWRARRLSPLAGERDGADRSSWKRCIAELCDADADVIVLALAGKIMMHASEPCLVTGADVSQFPEDHTLPLEWIRDKLRSCRADRVVVVGALDGPSDGDWLDALATNRARHVVAIERGTPLADVLRAQATDVREVGKRALLEASGKKEISMMAPVVFLILPITVLFALYPGLVTLISLTR